MDIEKKLFELQDLGYRDFHSKLMPNIPKEQIIGVRTPMLRKLAKDLEGAPDAAEFLSSLPHKYYEENNLHAFLIEKIKNFDEALFETNRFLPYIDNWATCDSFLPPVFKKNKNKLTAEIKKWIKSHKTYTVRFGIKLLMSLFLDEDFKEEYLSLVCSVNSDEYYVKMMVAWYFATALCKQYKFSIPFIEEKRLEPWVHNKAIQKALESRRTNEKTKEYLRSLKIK